MQNPYSRSLNHNIRKIYDINDNIIPELEQILSTEDRQKSYELLYVLLGKYNKHQVSGQRLSEKVNELVGKPDDRTNEKVNTIIGLLKDIKPQTVLDVGAGDGKITVAVKNFYNLPTEKIFAIDIKLPEIIDVTRLQYIEGKIPLPDNSIDLILLFSVLHHVVDRDSLMLEIKRVLKPGGYVIIREHDDNKDPNLYKYLDVLHLVYYTSFKETSDPLYLMSRQETGDLFNKYDMFSVNTMFYSPLIPNPQRIYHESFRKTYLPFQIKDREYFQNIIDNCKKESFIPPEKYKKNLKQMLVDIILVASRKEIEFDEIKYISNESINLALKELNIII